MGHNNCDPGATHGGGQDAGSVKTELDSLTAEIAACEAERADSITRMVMIADEVASAESELQRHAETAAATRADPCDCAERCEGDVTLINNGKASEEPCADEHVGRADSGVHVPYMASMRECIEAYRSVEVKKIPLQELAADATRKFKSPLFTRMKELLQEMKKIKVNYK